MLTEPIHPPIPMPKHFILLLIAFTLLHGVFLFQAPPPIEQDSSVSMLEEHQSTIFKYLDAEREFKLSLTILNLVCVFVNVTLIAIAFYYYLPAIDFWAYWKKWAREIKKKWIR